jgi:pyruvate dehydrogenase E1 component beta subunit
MIIQFYIVDRWLYEIKEEVPDEIYEVPLGRGKICKRGSDITVVAVSYLVQEAIKAADLLAAEGIYAEIIDPRTLKPLDIDIIMKSLEKTGRLIIANPDWPCCSFSEHVVSMILKTNFNILKSPVQYVNFPDSAVPASTPLEKAYFPDYKNIVSAVKKIFS